MNKEIDSIFKKVQNILLSYPQIKEGQTKKQLSYYDEFSVVAMLRVKSKSLVIAFGKGAKLQSKFPSLKGNGKIVRHLEIKSINELNIELLDSIIKESLILNIEAHELKKLTK
jgi:hypothetical protein